MMLSVASIIQEDDRDEIKCIFFSEFHPTAGPKIFSQVTVELALIAISQCTVTR